jgi:predicted amidohydrolase
MAMEGNYPENGRGLAMNGAEVLYRASMPCPFTENDLFEISNRARAFENNMYVVAPNIGSYTFIPTATILHRCRRRPVDDRRLSRPARG